jgi:hypothetical protein
MVTAVGMRLPKNLTYEEWRAIGERLLRTQNAAQWALADWLFEGEWRYGRQYEEALEMTGLPYGTLANLKWLAGRIDISRRRETLTLTHHVEVAPLPPVDQEVWLEKAEANGWSTRRLREEIAATREPKAKPTRGSRSASSDDVEKEEQGELVHLRAPASWQEAATARGITLSEWIVETCNAAIAV